MAKFIIEEQAAQNIINYLQLRPYNEVFQLIPLLLNMPEVPPEPKAKVAKESQKKRGADPSRQPA